MCHEAVHCLNYIPLFSRVQATGGYDGFVRLWKPFETRQPMSVGATVQFSINSCVVICLNISAVYRKFDPQKTGSLSPKCPCKHSIVTTTW